MIIESYTRIKRKIIVEVSLFLQAEGNHRFTKLRHPFKTFSYKINFAFDVLLLFNCVCSIHILYNKFFDCFFIRLSMFLLFFIYENELF